MNYPQTTEEAKKYRYGQWAGMPRGVAYDETRCAAGVFDNFIEHQCYRKRGHGLSGLYCKQHAARLTKHAPDVVESATSSDILPASEVSASKADSTPATTQVM